jgi:hypothetical protein
MKKTLLLIFASVWFIFNGNAQCNIDGGGILLNNQYVCQGTVVLINSIVAPSNISSNVSYQWELNGTIITGKNQGGMCDFSFNGIPSTTSIRRKVTDLTNSCSAYSNSVTFSVWSGLYAGSILGDDTLCTGAASSIINSTSLPSGGPNDGTDPGFSYTWQQSTNGGLNYSDWTTISGASNTSYNPGVLTTETQFRRVDESNFCGYGVYSNVITKTVMTCGVFSSDISGPISITPNQTANYSVIPVDGMKYLWAITNGTIMGGQGTNAITVLWNDASTSSLDHSVAVTETDATPESRTTTQDVTIAPTTSINKSFAVSGISVFPNPSRDQFNIVMPHSNTAVTYTLYSTTGVNMQSGSFTSSTSGTAIQTNLPAGIYQLVLSFDGEFTSTRLAVY